GRVEAPSALDGPLFNRRQRSTFRPALTRISAPGRFTTVRGWTDPFALVEAEDPRSEIASVLVQDSVDARYSGAAITQIPFTSCRALPASCGSRPIGRTRQRALVESDFVAR